MARLLACYVARVPVHTTEIELSTRGHADIVDITRRVQEAVSAAGVADGLASAFVRGSTAAMDGWCLRMDDAGDRRIDHG